MGRPASATCDGGTAVDETLRRDFFVPKQLKRAPYLGLVRLSPALMVRSRSRSSAVVRWRCHPLRHSPRTADSVLAALACPPLQFGLATFRPLALMEVTACRALHRFVLAATSGRCWPTALPLLPLAHGAPPESAPRVASRVSGCADGRQVAWQCASGLRAHTGSTSARLSACTASNYVGGQCAGALTWVQGPLVVHSPSASTPLNDREPCPMRRNEAIDH